MLLPRSMAIGSAASDRISLPGGSQSSSPGSNGRVGDQTHALKPRAARTITGRTLGWTPDSEFTIFVCRAGQSDRPAHAILPLNETLMRRRLTFAIGVA